MEEFVFDLPQHLIEKILLRLPFPHILKTRLLGKSWAANFADTCKRKVVASSSSISITTRSNSVYITLSSLQQELLSVSSRWPIFVPTLYSERDCLGFQPETSSWNRFSLNPALTRFPKSYRQMDSCGGCILCTVYSHQTPKLRIRISNVFTGSSIDRDVPAPPAAGILISNLRGVHVVSSRACFHYKIYLLYSVLAGGNCIHVTTQIYDPISNLWETQVLEHAPRVPRGEAAMMMVNIHGDFFYHLGKYSSIAVGESLFFIVIGYPSCHKLLCKLDMRRATLKTWFLSLLLPARRKLRAYNLTRRRAVVQQQQSDHHGGETDDDRLQLILLWMLNPFWLRSTGRVSQFYLEVCSLNPENLQEDSGDGFVSEPTDFGGEARAGVSIRIVHHNDVIYFCFCQTTSTIMRSRRIWCYDLRRRAWNFLPLIPDDPMALELFWVSSAFAPGLNPFANVSF